MATCDERAVEYVRLAAPSLCAGATGFGAGRCRDSLMTNYKKWYCAPGQDWTSYVGHVWEKTAKQSSGWPRGPGAQMCFTSPMIKKIAEALVRQDTRSREVVKGLGLDTITSGGKLASTVYPYIPTWKQDRGYDVEGRLRQARDGNRYLKGGPVRRTKITIGGREYEVLSIEAPDCRQRDVPAGWMIVDDPSGSFPPYSSRARGLKKDDWVYWIKYYQTNGDFSSCTLLGKVPPYITALNDVRSKGVESPYFVFHEWWKGLDSRDVTIAKRSTSNALLYFLPPTTATRTRIAEYKANLQKEQAVETATSTQKNTLGPGLALLSLTNPLNTYRHGRMTLEQAQGIWKNDWPLCSETKARLEVAVEERKIQEEIEKDIQAIIDYQLSILAEEGYVIPDELKTELKSGSESGEEGAEEDEGASSPPAIPAWAIMGMLGGLAYVGYKFLQGR